MRECHDLQTDRKRRRDFEGSIERILIMSSGGRYSAIFDLWSEGGRSPNDSGSVSKG